MPFELPCDPLHSGFRAQNNLGLALDRIARDAGNYYVLGYHPLRPELDGSFRGIEVKVRRPDLRVRARRGYIAGRTSEVK